MEYVWLFLLFFAVLAAAWFYLQRAKARPTNHGDDHHGGTCAQRGSY